MNPVVQIQVKYVVLVTSVERVKYLIELRLQHLSPPATPARLLSNRKLYGSKDGFFIMRCDIF